MRPSSVAGTSARRVTAAYSELFESGRFPSDLLGAETRARAEALEADASIKKLPDALQMAMVADRWWMPRIPLIHPTRWSSATSWR